MEILSTSNGRERNGRVGDNKVRQRIPPKLNLVTISVVALSLLIFAKIGISSFYLKLGPMKFKTANLAQAGEDNIEKDPVIDERERTLNKKEQELNEREMELERRENNMLPLKNEIDTKLEELMELQTRLTVFAKDLAEREKALSDGRISHLVSLYSAMEPSRAAAILDKLDTAVVVRILGNMKGKSAGEILAVMKPEKGAVISEHLSRVD
ncbi:MAG: hypothetical protein JW882_03400 [Deltaproteobacteria bacterium]|nr:hypothetical protein [Deltaproteobacteria bacterium]